MRITGLVLTALLLAGCSAPPARHGPLELVASETSTDASPPPTAFNGTELAIALSEGRTQEPDAGAPENTENTTIDPFHPPPAVVSEPVAVSWDGTTAAFLCIARAVCVVEGSPDRHSFTMPEHGWSAHFEVTWNADDASSQRLNVTAAGVSKEGPSPLVLDLLAQQGVAVRVTCPMGDGVSTCPHQDFHVSGLLR